MTIKMFTELGRRMEEHRISRKRKYKKEPVQDEEYSSFNEKYAREN